VGISSILLRALIVLILFFLFAAAVNFIAVTFLNSGTNDNFSSEKGATAAEGGKINIVLTEDDDAISELPSEPVEQDGEETLQAEENVLPSDRSADSGISSANSASAASMDIDSLPDLGSFSTTFSSAVDNEEKKTDSDVESGYNESNSFSTGSKLSAAGIAGTIAEQNKPEDLAKAVKTVLKRGD